MAHFILEYSDNIATEHLALQELFGKLHEQARQSGLFPYKGIRSRAYCSNEYRMADGNPSHQFMHLSVLIGAGRSEAEKLSAAQAMFDIYEAHFSPCFVGRGVAMSFEMRELDAVLKFNKNNIADYL